jgi:catechol 2,3-dioxygenase-like lactoylglutathione lyase family enzyme
MVIRTSNLERLREFYSTLGLELVQERHGAGPLHYSCSMNGTVMEIYPTKRPVAGGNRLGLRLKTPTAAIERLQLAGYLPGGAELLNREASPAFLVHDPDGNQLEISS